MNEGDNKQQDQNKRELFKRYWSFIRPYRFLLLLIIFLGLLQLAAPLTVPWMTGVLVDQVFDKEVAETSNWTLNKSVQIMAGAFLLTVFVRFIRNLVTAHLGSTMVVNIRQQLYAHLQKLSPKFYENRPVGGIVSRVLNDVNGAQNLVGNA